MNDEKSQDTKRISDFLRKFKNDYQISMKYALNSKDPKYIKIKDIKDIPKIPEEFNSNENWELLKWYSAKSNRLDSFYDNGEELPEVDSFKIISTTSTISSLNESDIFSNTWILGKVKSGVKSNDK